MNNKYEVVVQEKQDSLRVRVTVCDDQNEPNQVIWINTNDRGEAEDDEDATNKALYYAARRILELEEKLGD